MRRINKEDRVVIMRESKLNNMKHMYYSFGFLFGSALTMFLLSDYVMLSTGWGLGFKFGE